MEGQGHIHREGDGGWGESRLVFSRCCLSIVGQRFRTAGTGDNSSCDGGFGHLLYELQEAVRQFDVFWERLNDGAERQHPSLNGEVR